MPLQRKSSTPQRPELSADPTLPPAPTVMCEGKYLRLVKSGPWEYVERTKVSGVVVIAALTRKREFVLIEQFRPALGRRVIELPAGLAGDVAGSESELLETAARRELLEETGYEAGKLRYLTVGPPSAGQSNEMLTFYLATGLKKTGDGGGDASEQIDLHLVPLADCDRWLKRAAKRGLVIDPKVYLGLYFAERHAR